MKILVVCNAGMSSSILVKKIADYAKSIGEDATVQAVRKMGCLLCSTADQICGQ